jgi:dolichol-phosphate mannosyltransferase
MTKQYPMRAPSKELKMLTTIVLPTYNEAENLPLMIEQFFALKLEGLRVLVVDDNSPDGTGDTADGFARQYPNVVSVMHRTQKAGLGAAYRAGFKQALSMGADYIIQMDCDFSHQPKYLPQMIEEASDYDLVIGSRYMKGSSVDESWSAFRKLLSWFGNAVYVPTILSIPIRDATGGFKLWRRQTLIGLDLDRISSNGYIFQVETTYIANRLGYRIKELPIHFPDRTRGTSKMDMRIQLEAAMRVWQIMAAHRRLTPQMRRPEAYS